MSNGICKRDKETGKVTQLFNDISFGEAFIKVFELRSKKDGNWYWIGKAKNHR